VTIRIKAITWDIIEGLAIVLQEGERAGV